MLVAESKSVTGKGGEKSKVTKTTKSFDQKSMDADVHDFNYKEDASIKPTYHTVLPSRTFNSSPDVFTNCGIKNHQNPMASSRRQTGIPSVCENGSTGTQGDVLVLGQEICRREWSH